MLLKILLTIAAFTAVWAIFFRGRARRDRIKGPRRRNPLQGQTLVKCPSCGIYIALGDTCNCKDAA